MPALAVLLAVIGCGADKTVATPEPSDPGPTHVHGLGVDPRDGALFLATHTGLFRSEEGKRSAKRVGDSFQDTMGFTVTGPGRFLGSGHPDARTDQPPLLGLIESRDAGKAWNPVALTGQADFHVLRTEGSSVVGYDSANNRLLRFSGTDRQPTRLATPRGTLIDLAIDPSDEDHYVAAADTGIYESRNGGTRWSRVDRRRTGLLAYFDAERLVLVRGDGVVEQRVSSGGWKPVGKVVGPPGAFSAHEGKLFLAVQDGPVMQSSDGGRNWVVRVDTGL